MGGGVSGTWASLIQFPWRFLNFCAFFLSLYFAEITKNRLRKLNFILIILLSILLVIGAESQFKLQETQEFHVATTKSDFENPWPTFINSNNYAKVLRKNRNYAHFNDYVPTNSYKHLNSIFKHEICIGHNIYVPSSIKTYRHRITYSLNRDVHKNTQVSLPFLIYNSKDYKLKLNGNTIPFKKGNNGCISFNAPYHVKKMHVSISFKEPVCFAIARVISLISLIMSLICLLMTCKNI